MKRHQITVLSVLLAVLLMGATAQAQGVTPNPQDLRVQEFARQIRNLATQQALAQRGGGARGVPPGTVIGQEGRFRILSPTNPQLFGAWWTNTALVQRLGLTDDQKAKIERAFENHRQRIMSSTELLEKEEALLARLLEAEPLDRNAVLTQIDRVTQARGEMERANSAMTLEMRESLTRAQWMQLQSPVLPDLRYSRTVAEAVRGAAQSPPQRVRVGANVIAANLISQVEPAYTGTPGTVVLEAEISREGIVENVKAVSGPPQLTQAALDAVKQWRYKPTLLNGEPVPVVTSITVNFPFSAGGRGGRGAAPVPSPAGPGQRRGPGRQ